MLPTLACPRTTVGRYLGESQYNITSCLQLELLQILDSKLKTLVDLLNLRPITNTGRPLPTSLATHSLRDRVRPVARNSALLAQGLGNH